MDKHNYFSPSNPIRRNTTRARGRSYKKDKVNNNYTKNALILNLKLIFLFVLFGFLFSLTSAICCYSTKYTEFS